MALASIDPRYELAGALTGLVSVETRPGRPGPALATLADVRALGL